MAVVYMLALSILLGNQSSIQDIMDIIVRHISQQQSTTGTLCPQFKFRSPTETISVILSWNRP